MCGDSDRHRKRASVTRSEKRSTMSLPPGRDIIERRRVLGFHVVERDRSDATRADDEIVDDGVRVDGVGDREGIGGWDGW